MRWLIEGALHCAFVSKLGDDKNDLWSEATARGNRRLCSVFFHFSLWRGGGLFSPEVWNEKVLSVKECRRVKRFPNTLNQFIQFSTHLDRFWFLEVKFSFFFFLAPKSREKKFFFKFTSKISTFWKFILNFYSGPEYCLGGAAVHFGFDLRWLNSTRYSSWLEVPHIIVNFIRFGYVEVYIGLRKEKKAFRRGWFKLWQ